MTTTWSSAGVKKSLLVESTGTGDAPSAKTNGLSLVGISSVCVFVESTASTFTAGSLLAYLWNEDSGSSGAWFRAPDLDLTITAVAKWGTLGVNVKANGSRLAYTPSGLGQANKVYIHGYGA